MKGDCECRFEAYYAMSPRPVLCLCMPMPVSSVACIK